MRVDAFLSKDWRLISEHVFLRPEGVLKSAPYHSVMTKKKKKKKKRGMRQKMGEDQVMSQVTHGCSATFDFIYKEHSVSSYPKSFIFHPE